MVQWISGLISMHLWMTRGDIYNIWLLKPNKHIEKTRMTDAWRGYCLLYEAVREQVNNYCSPVISCYDGSVESIEYANKVCTYRIPFISLGGRISTQWWPIRLWAIRVNTTASDINLQVIVAICPSKRKRFLNQWHWHHRKTSGFSFCPRPLRPM